MNYVWNIIIIYELTKEGISALELTHDIIPGIMKLNVDKLQISFRVNKPYKDVKVKIYQNDVLIKVFAISKASSLEVFSPKATILESLSLRYLQFYMW